MSGLNGYTTVYPHGIWIFVLSQPTINTRDLLGNIVLLLLHYGSIFRKGGRDSLICNRGYNRFAKIDAARHNSKVDEHSLPAYIYRTGLFEAQGFIEAWTERENRA